MMLVFDKDILKVLTVFSISPGSKFVRKELKEKTFLDNASLDRSLQILSNSEIIKKENRIHFLNFENENSKKIIDIIASQHKKMKELPLAVYFAICDLITALSANKDIKIYLFGSYSKLIFKEPSDIDIALIPERIDKKKTEIIVKKIEEKYGRKIELHYFGKDFYKNKEDPLIRDILRNGVKLI